MHADPLCSLLSFGDHAEKGIASRSWLLAVPRWWYFAAQQIDNIPVQHEPELAKHEQRWVANRAFYLADVSSINVSVKGKLLL